ncbi:hypothetical protein [Salinirubrum litoreum]|uniref:Uncharacterized protein n=1 Tax=Salinirubrum litoreum TaxID=1126234 RepID=A0ABD5RFN7_9EURY|nr:hypothetical protein [Salinirubrum litoreum]
MSRADSHPPDSTAESIHREYPLDVRIVEVDESEQHGDDVGPRYRFEAPQHVEIEFEAAETAELYADVYFDTNGFQEAGTGDRGIPPEVVQAGRDTLAAYMLTQPMADEYFVASFFGKKPSRIQRYVSWVQDRAEEIRAGVEAEGIESAD